MFQLLNEALLPANMAYTCLLVLALIYWIFVILGAFDLDVLDFDFDVDADVDVDVDTDIDASSLGGIFSGLLSFFNFGKVPFMILYSFNSLWMWVLGIMTNHYIGNGSLTYFFIFLIPIIIIAMIITKMITMPFLPFFEGFNTGMEPTDYSGEVGTMKTNLLRNRYGKAEVIIGNDTHHISVKLIDDAKVSRVDRDHEVVILGRDDSGKFFWVDAFTDNLSLDNT